MVFSIFQVVEVSVVVEYFSDEQVFDATIGVNFTSFHAVGDRR